MVSMYCYKQNARPIKNNLLKRILIENSILWFFIYLGDACFEPIQFDWATEYGWHFLNMHAYVVSYENYVLFILNEAV